VYYKGKEVSELGHGHDGSDLHGFGEQIRVELSKRIPRDEEVKVLDVGTGFAMTTEFLARTLSKGSRIWTLDPSSEVLQHAREKLETKGLATRVEFVCGSVDHIRFHDGYFGLVLSVMMLHHVEGAPKGLREMARVVRAGGRIVVVDYSPDAASELEFRARHARQDFLPMSEVDKVLATNGFAVKSSDFGRWYLVDGRRLPKD
jgi:ubiquinone/menaquinone biosynthesis C-methylase UbiE